MDLLIFDLDGTLIDSKLDLANAVNATRAHMGLPPLANELVYSYVGNGAPVLIRRSMGPEMPQPEVDRALEYFLEHYRRHSLEFTVLYPGIQDVLDEFRESGRRLAVLTNKPIGVTNDILRGMGVLDHFFRVYGGDSFDRKKPDPIGIERLMEESGTGRDRTAMIGDSAVDVKTARNAGVRSVGVTWGFQPESLKGEAPDVLVDRAEQLREWVNQSF